MVFPTISGRSSCNFVSIEKKFGFTFVELMVVMSIISLLLTIALPRYFDGLQRAKDTVLKEDLAIMRDAIDQYHTDKGVYPQYLQVLVEKRYLRFIPEDPITEQSDSWISMYSSGSTQGIYDVRSGSDKAASDGTFYSEW